MIYLIAKFALLFLAATILGLLLGYWWAKSRFVDVTESYHSLTSRSKEDRAAMDRIWEKVNSLNLFPIENRMNSIEGLIRNLPEPEKAIPVNLNPVHEQIHQVEQLVKSIPQPEKVDFLPLYQKIQLLEGRIKTMSEKDSIDLSPFHQKFLALEGQLKSLPQPTRVDLAPLNNKLQSLEGQLKSLPQPAKVDLTPINQKLQSLEGQLRSMPRHENVDLAPINQKLQSLEGQLRSMPRYENVDLAPINQKLNALEGQLKSMPQPAKVDLNPLHQRLQSLESQLRALPQPAKVDLNPMNQRLHSLENQLKSMPRPEKVDLAPLHGKLQLLASEIKSTPAPAHKPVNIAPLNDRMVRIEQAINALKGSDSVDLQPIELRLQAIEAKLGQLPTKGSSSGSSNGAGPRLLRSASMGKKDDLKQISGVGPKLERLLNQIGVYYFWQVASWNHADVEAVDDMLDVFKGRIERDNWVTQANKLKLMPGAAKENMQETKGSVSADNGLSALFVK